MKVLIINQRKGDLKGFISYVEKNYPDIEITELAAFYSIAKKIFSKKSMVLQFFLNYLHLISNLTVLKGKEFDFIFKHTLGFFS